MRIHLFTVSARVSGWVAAGFEEYARRLPVEWRLTLREIPASKRRSAGPAQCVQEEGRRVLAALPRDSYLVALHEGGESWSSAELAVRIGAWLQSGREVGLLVGGPDGLASDCLQRADALWSLSRLTLPHELVRVIVAEQLYRASTILQGHPYHRA